MGETVAVTGDGVNDSAALLEANVGIAMGVGGTDVARESADIVLLENDFTSIVEAVKLGRSTFDNMRNFVYYVFTHNFAELLAFLIFVLAQMPLPLLVVQVLAIDLLMDILPSLSLIMEPPDRDIMLRQPKKKKARLISIWILLRSCYVGMLIYAGAILWTLNIWTDGGWIYGQNAILDPQLYARGTTIVMVGIMMGQLGNLFSARSSTQTVFRMNPLRNKWIFLGILALFSLIMAIIYIPFLQPIFGTAPLLPLDWLILITLAPIALLLEELRKIITRKLKHQQMHRS